MRKMVMEMITYAHCLTPIFDFISKDKVVHTLVEHDPPKNCGCSSFDQPDLQSLNDCKFVFFSLVTGNLKNWACVVHHWHSFLQVIHLILSQNALPRL